VYIIARNAKAAALVNSQRETIAALARSSQAPPSTIHLVAGDCQPPRGCATEILDSTFEVHVMLLGLIDLSREVARLNKEKAAVGGRIDKLKGKMDMPEYSTKCKPQQQARRRHAGPAARPPHGLALPPPTLPRILTETPPLSHFTTPLPAHDD
jgi:valyl-tRNA synthetase